MTPLDAFDAVAEMFRTAWLADHRTKHVPIDWPEVEQANVPPPDGGEFARFTMQHSTGGQRSVGSAEGAHLHEHGGTVIIQVFGSRRTGTNAKRAAYELAEVALRALQGKAAGGVWFRDVGLRDVGADGPLYQINVNAPFQHDQARGAA